MTYSKKEGELKCCVLNPVSWQWHRDHVTQSTLGRAIKYRPVYIHIVTSPLLNTWSGVFLFHKNMITGFTLYRVIHFLLH